MGFKYTYTKFDEKTLATNIKTPHNCNASTNFYHRDGRSEAVMQKLAIRLQSSRQSQSKSPSGKQCILCSRIGQYVTCFVNWRESEQGFVVKHLGSNPPDDSYVCKRDFLEAK